MTLPEHHRPFMGGKILACPMRGHSTSFQLVDEFGSGQPYAGLTYEVTDYEDIVYTGKLDATGSGKVTNHYCGPVILKLNKPYEGQDKTYVRLRERKHYPLPITELQVRAEKTRFFNKAGLRTQANPAQDKAGAGAYYQVEVSELVKHMAHLPPLAERGFPPKAHVLSMMRQQSDVAMEMLGGGPRPPRLYGVGLLPNTHHVLEVRPLRALRPMLSTHNDFCALNLYQLALMATLSYTPFGQVPDSQPVETDRVKFPLQPSSGNWFGHALPKADELWRVDAGQKPEKPYYPLYEEVPYSRRLEIVPFDPELYPEVNAPTLGREQENPANIHSFDDSKDDEGTDTQAYITHHDELILIAVRGTNEMPWDLLRDIDAQQVPFEEGVGQAHRGFYLAAKAIRGFVVTYLDKFYSGQKLIITGHSLGGAVALLLAEMLRRRAEQYDILLYTYGAPRAADETFVKGAATLKHHRMVNHNDPIPSVPGTGMDTKPTVFVTGLVVSFVNTPLGVAMFLAGVSNLSGAPYAHHGTLHHFMPVRFEDGRQSSILWEPGCDSIAHHACHEVLQHVNGLPTRRAFEPAFYILNHLMVGGYVPNSWATLRRWQESQELQRSLVTPREFDWVNNALQSMSRQLLTFSREARSDAYRRLHEKAFTALSVEIDKLEGTRTRLEKLRYKSASEVDVYGQFATQPEVLAESLPRWKAHTLNTAPEQLAMTPPEVIRIVRGHVIGAPYHLDIDSFT
ncbi:lipase family protein [Pseudomonas sp. H11T01]|uniref:lipase family protein n=1 Tax=Pseudomonas sp. H11T01 TaxID=3402749 RepID=UPI003AD060FD